MKSWLKQLHAISHGMLFNRGHVSNVQTALTLHAVIAAPEPTSIVADDRGDGHALESLHGCCPALAS